METKKRCFYTGENHQYIQDDLKAGSRRLKGVLYKLFELNTQIFSTERGPRIKTSSRACCDRTGDNGFKLKETDLD